MSYEDNSQRQKPFQSMRESVSMLWICCRIINAPLQALGRGGPFGCQFFGVPAMISLLAVPLVCGFAAQSSQRQFPRVFPPGRHFDAVPFFLLIYLGALLEHRARYARLSPSKKASVHSRWGGSSMWKKLLKSERAARLFGEPIYWAVIGLVLRDDYMYRVQDVYIVVGPLGSYFLLGALTLFIEAMLCDQVDRARLRSIQDAQLENAYFAELYQRGQGRD
jgi:hypothetical protein